MSVSQVEREIGHRAQKKTLPTLDELISKAHGNESGGLWIKYRGVIVAIAASSEAQEEFSSAHNWPCAYSQVT